MQQKHNSESQKIFTSQATCTQIAPWLWIDSEVIQFLPFIASENYREAIITCREGHVKSTHSDPPIVTYIYDRR